MRIIIFDFFFLEKWGGGDLTHPRIFKKKKRGGGGGILICWGGGYTFFIDFTVNFLFSIQLLHGLIKMGMGGGGTSCQFNFMYVSLNEKIIAAEKRGRASPNWKISSSLIHPISFFLSKNLQDRKHLSYGD